VARWCNGTIKNRKQQAMMHHFALFYVFSEEFIEKIPTDLAK
jgi:hypothetical protein